MIRKSKPIPEKPTRVDKRRNHREADGGPAAEQQTPEALRAEQIRGSGQRETVEAFVVAFILALLFRAFIAEAFVIPTGSMAPTLMGAHKDVNCDRCGHLFPLGASLERRGPDTEAVVVGGVCPNCRYTNSLDLAEDANHTTFSGDRILVSKFAYTLSDPERWDVIVFKFPGNPKQNYIKRLVGLPEETLTIRHGDVYARPTGQEGARDEIVRKPPEKLLAMRHLVHDTAYQPEVLIEADYPSRWQPWGPGAQSPPTDGWKVERNAEGLTATLAPAGGAGSDGAGSDGAGAIQWLRYFHRWPTVAEWAEADAGGSLADVDPYQGRLITDFYTYDSSISVDAREVYRRPPSQRHGSRLGRIFGSGYGGGEFQPDYRSGAGLEQFRRLSFGSNNTGLDGLHWVGDLILEADIETSDDSQELILELVEAGVRFRCRFSLQDGTAVLEMWDEVAGVAAGEEAQLAFEDGEGSRSLSPTASTNVRAGQRARIRFSNSDDELLLWVDDSLVSFDGPTRFDSRRFRPPSENYPRYGGVGQPLDGAPAAVGVRGGAAMIRHLRIDRDQYYIATKDSQGGVYDYDRSQLWSLTNRNVSLREIQAVMADPELWSQFPGWDARRTVSYVLEEDQYFPMGDNSPESLDARCWAGAKVGPHRAVDEDAYRWSHASYVPRDLLVGKAVMIFWPHPWNSPVPMTPNFRRMQLIR